MPYPEFYLVLEFFPDFSGHSENLHISMGHCRKFSESTALLQTSNQYYNGPTNASMDSIRVAKPQVWNSIEHEWGHCSTGYEFGKIVVDELNLVNKFYFLKTLTILPLETTVHQIEFWKNKGEFWKKLRFYFKMAQKDKIKGFIFYFHWQYYTGLLKLREK